MSKARRDFICPFCNKHIAESLGGEIGWSETKATIITKGQTVKTRQYFHVKCFNENTIGAKKKNGK